MMSLFLSLELGFSIGPVPDLLVRKAYTAAYDRRMRHPAWVSYLSKLQQLLTNSAHRLQSISLSHLLANPVSSVPQGMGHPTAQTRRSRRMNLSLQFSARSCKIISEVGMIVDTCAYVSFSERADSD